jgi:stress response protein YsnF
VRGLDDADLGEVQEVNQTIIVTEKGSLSKERLYLPKSIQHGYNGRILLFDIMEEEAKNKFMTEPTTTTLSSTEEGAKISTADTEKTENSIPVIEERLEMSKKESMEEAKVIKKPSKKTKTVEVELMHEELIIEKKAVQDKTSTTTPKMSPSSEEIMQSKTEINIPLMREDVVVSRSHMLKKK